jgi:glycosyltransferase involved in cell wall biosynthesis
MIEKINICYFIGSFHVGGAENHIFQITSHLDRKKFNPFICVFRNEGAYHSQFKDLNIPIIEFKFKKYLFPIYLFKFIIFLKKNRIDLIHIHLGGTFLFAMAGACLAGIKKRIITWHNIYKSTFLKHPYSWFSLNFANLLATIIIAVSDEVKKVNQKKYHVKNSKVITVHNGISFPILKPKKINSGKINIGIIGNLIEQKGHRYLIEAIKVIIDSNKNVHLMIIGDGLLKEDIKSFIIGYEQHISLLGNRTDIPHLLKQIDIIVMPSLYEGFSIVLLESMASGKPIIATRVGGNAEAIEHKKSGYLIKSKSSKEIIDALNTLFHDSNFTYNIGVAAQRRFLENFTTDKMMEKLYNIYI